MTDRFCHDDSQVKPLLEQINEPIDQFTGDGADETPVYEEVLTGLSNADVVIPPRPAVTKAHNRSFT